MDSSTETATLCESAHQHLCQKELTDAIDLYEEALEIDDRCCDALEGIATAYYLGQDYRSAEEHFKRVTQLRPLDGKVLINLGGVLNLQEKYSEAVKVLQKGSLKEKKSFEAFYNLGLAYRGMKQSSMAISAYKEAIRLAPGNAEVYQNIANVYLDQNNYRMAIDNYKKALELNPDFQKAKTGLENAEALQRNAKQTANPFGRLVNPASQSKKTPTMTRELTVSERHDDRVAVRNLAKRSEEGAKMLLQFLKNDFEPTLLKLNRSVAEMTENPWAITETGGEFRAIVQQCLQLRQQIQKKMTELQKHEEIINPPTS